MSRLAIIDIGTNTFHLVIAERSLKGLSLIVKKTLPVKLGEDSFPEGNIKPAAYNRAINAFDDFRKTLDEYKVSNITAVATESLRKAGDRAKFIKEIKEKFSINIVVISGETEAELICLSVIKLLNISQRALVMDIGGGSTEFIIAGPEGMYWKNSYPLGSTILKNHFHKTDPINNDSINNLREYIDKQLSSMYDRVIEFKPELIIGTSGSFETICDIMYEDRGDYWSLKSLDINEFRKIYDLIIRSKDSERLKIKGITPFRSPLMPVAMIQIQRILEKTGIKRLALAQTALKEGLAWAKLYGYEVKL